MGHIKLDRKILEWEWYTDINTCRLFLHMLLRANWKDGRFQGADIPRGSFVSSYQNLALETGLSVRNVRTALEHLKTTGEVTVNRHPKYSVFTVNNYCQYQSTDKVSDTQPTINRQSTDSQPTTIEEEKEVKKGRSNNTSNEVCLPDVFATIREFYNSVCGSYPRLVKMSDARKKAIRARLNTGYTIDDFETLFRKAEASDFLKGKNDRNWSATFDWLIADANMAKVLDGNYDKVQTESRPVVKNKFNNFEQRDYNYADLEKQLLAGGKHET